MRLVVLAIAVALAGGVVVPVADSASLRKQCRRECRPAVESCVDTHPVFVNCQKRVRKCRRKATRKCRRQVERGCRRAGLQVCGPAATTPVPPVGISTTTLRPIVQTTTTTVLPIFPTTTTIVLPVPPPTCGGEFVIFATDGTYLGCVTCSEFSPDSVFNEFGLYGSEFSLTSIWNEFSPYGSPFGSLSACNEFTSSPPVVFDEAGCFVIRLSVNPFVADSVCGITGDAGLCALLHAACDSP